MATITITLRNTKYAPWGLLTDEEHPRTIVWLTAENPVCEIDSGYLTDWDLVRIQESVRNGFIDASGVEELEIVTIQQSTDPSSKFKGNTVPIDSKPEPKDIDQNMIMDVSALMREQIKKSEEANKAVDSGYPKAAEILQQKAPDLKKALKELAKTGAPVSLFQDCRRKETQGKNRKTVIAVLLDIIKTKIDLVAENGHRSAQYGQSKLADIYFDQIEEYEDEEEEVTIQFAAPSIETE